MSHPERYGAGALRSGAAIDPTSHLGAMRAPSVSDYEAKLAASEAPPALHQIAARLEQLICRTTDTNLATRMFVDRVAGSRPEAVSKGDPNNTDAGNVRPTAQVILMMLNSLESRVTEAEHLSRELGRIG